VRYTVEMLVRLPVMVAATARQLGANTGDWARTRGHRVSLLDGRLTIGFLTGPPTAIVPLAFGERFTVAVFDGVAVDPGSARMRRSLGRHLDALGGALHTVVATHAHEEHVGNLDWLADRIGAEVRVSPATAALLQPPYRVPLGRRMVIGAIPALRRWQPLGDRVATTTGHLEVLPAPGHTLDHVVFFDPAEGMLLAGDSFMGETFATPNADVDADRWIATLERLSTLDVTMLVEAHGHVHTLRTDVPDVAGVVVRRHPQEAIRAKLDYLRWLRDQVEAGRRQGLSDRAIEAICYPWGPQWSWERKGLDELARLLTRGRFSRTQVVRSFPPRETP
jgi:glyoxylase-like metal-dependent hydrolase (beta-lactamase superfamily II)